MTSGQNLTPQPPSLKRKGELEGCLTLLRLPVDGFVHSSSRETAGNDPTTFVSATGG